MCVCASVYSLIFKEEEKTRDGDREGLFGAFLLSELDIVVQVKLSTSTLSGVNP